MGRGKKYRLLIVIEKAETNYAAYSPDLPGCVATGKTREEAEEQMHEAIALHIEGIKEDGLPIPQACFSFMGIRVIYPKPQERLVEASL